MKIRTCHECGTEYADNTTKTCTAGSPFNPCGGQVLPPPKEPKKCPKE